MLNIFRTILVHIIVQRFQLMVELNIKPFFTISDRSPIGVPPNEALLIISIQGSGPERGLQVGLKG